MLIAQLAVGQDYATLAQRRAIIKVAPLSLFDYDNTLQLGIEVPLSKTTNRMSFQQEVGYGHGRFNIWSQGDDFLSNKQTWKFRSQLRFYLISKPIARMYLAGEYMFKNVRKWELREVSPCTYGNCYPVVQQNVHFQKNVTALHVKLGWQFYFKNRTTLDLTTGFGLRSPKYRVLTPGVTVDPRYAFGDWWWTSGGSEGEVTVDPSLAFGVQIGILLGKLPSP